MTSLLTASLRRNVNQKPLMLVACALSAVYEGARGDESDETNSKNIINLSLGPSMLYPQKIGCEEGMPQKLVKFNESRSETPSIQPISWVRKSLYNWYIIPWLPLPRVLTPNDPDLVVPPQLIKRRQSDERRLKKFQEDIRSAIFKQTHAKSKKEEESAKQLVESLLVESFEVMYGKGTTPAKRQIFLERYGCTGWTEEIIRELLEVAGDRGIVEIGAGNGQWARALTDAYNDHHHDIGTDKKNGRRDRPINEKRFDFVMAYDNMSKLPLNPEIYHKTQPCHDHFFDRVEPCNSIQLILSKWTSRGRVLLLVYPPPYSSMAMEAAQAYENADSHLNDTIVYVGEGRGGANANDEFFDFLESSGNWILRKIMPVESFGTKGFEKLFIFKRRGQS